MSPSRNQSSGEEHANNMESEVVQHVPEVNAPRGQGDILSGNRDAQLVEESV